jgi:hypothetical protein
VSKPTAAEAQKAYRLATIYKQTPQDRENKLIEQNHKCPICDRVFLPVGKFRPQQDHDHKCCPMKKKNPSYCGKCCRSLLCFICNKKVVGVLEKIERLGIDVQRALTYIKYWNKVLTERGAYAKKPSTKKAKKLRKV